MGFMSKGTYSGGSGVGDGDGIGKGKSKMKEPNESQKGMDSSEISGNQNEARSNFVPT